MQSACVTRQSLTTGNNPKVSPKAQQCIHGTRVQQVQLSSSQSHTTRHVSLLHATCHAAYRRRHPRARSAPWWGLPATEERRAAEAGSSSSSLESHSQGQRGGGKSGVKVGFAWQNQFRENATVVSTKQESEHTRDVALRETEAVGSVSEQVEEEREQVEGEREQVEREGEVLTEAGSKVEAVEEVGSGEGGEAESRAEVIALGEGQETEKREAARAVSDVQSSADEAVVSIGGSEAAVDDTVVSIVGGSEGAADAAESTDVTAVAYGEQGAAEGEEETEEETEEEKKEENKNAESRGSTAAERDEEMAPMVADEEEQEEAERADSDDEERQAEEEEAKVHEAAKAGMQEESRKVQSSESMFSRIAQQMRSVLMPNAAGSAEVASKALEEAGGRAEELPSAAAAAAAKTAEADVAEGGLALKKPSSSYRIQVATHLAQGQREEMEDDVVVVEDEEEGVVFAAVFDGHAGSASAAFLREQLFKECMHHLPEHDLRDDDDVDDAMEAMQRAFETTDEKLLKMLDENSDNSGSTATAVLIRGGLILVANVGDSRAVISYGDDVVDMTRDHRPHGESPAAKEETARIKEAGGWVSAGRVCGVVAVSRAFGNFRFKMGREQMLKEGIRRGKWTTRFVNKLRVEEDWITATPEVFSFRTKRGGTDGNDSSDSSHADIIILGSDGLWDKVRSSEAIRFVRKQLEGGSSLQDACEELVKFALHERKSDDNICVVVMKMEHT